MSNKDYKKIIIEKLLSKYNSRIAKNTNTNRRIILKPTEVYKNYADYNADIVEKQNFNEAIEALSKMKVITADCLKFSTDIEKIYLCDDKVDVIYEYLKAEYGVIPKSSILRQVKAMLEKYCCAGQLIRNYCKSILSQIEDPRVQVDLDRMKANLKMLDFLDKNEKNLYVREVSMLVYGDSKWFEKNNCDEICNIARNALNMPKEESEKNDAILAYYHITPTEQEIFIKGDWKIEWDCYTLETAKLQGGIAIVSNDIKRIRKITIRSSRMMTIENKTSYQRMDSSNVAAMYLGGFANRHQIQFLLKVIEDNPNITYYHFGDIDVGGFLIHKHLCRMTSTNFILYCMGTEQLRDERFKNCLKELTDNDAIRLEPLLEEEPYSVVVNYMKDHNVKLEQEIVSYYLSRT